jgi:uncharacterized protein YggT (Ycf19 family)
MLISEFRLQFLNYSFFVQSALILIHEISSHKNIGEFLIQIFEKLLASIKWSVQVTN